MIGLIEKNYGKMGVVFSNFKTKRLILLLTFK